MLVVIQRSLPHFSLQFLCYIQRKLGNLFGKLTASLHLLAITLVCCITGLPDLIKLLVVFPSYSIIFLLVIIFYSVKIITEETVTSSNEWFAVISWLFMDNSIVDKCSLGLPGTDEWDKFRKTMRLGNEETYPGKTSRNSWNVEIYSWLDANKILKQVITSQIGCWYKF